MEFEGRGGWVDQIRAAFVWLSNHARGIMCIALDLDVWMRGGTCTLHVLSYRDMNVIHVFTCIYMYFPFAYRRYGCMYLLHALYVTRTTWIGTFTTHAGTYRVFGTFFECQCLVVAKSLLFVPSSTNLWLYWFCLVVFHVLLPSHSNMERRQLVDWLSRRVI